LQFRQLDCPSVDGRIGVKKENMNHELSQYPEYPEKVKYSENPAPQQAPSVICKFELKHE